MFFFPIQSVLFFVHLVQSELKRGQNFWPLKNVFFWYSFSMLDLWEHIMAILPSRPEPLGGHGTKNCNFAWGLKIKDLTPIKPKHFWAKIGQNWPKSTMRIMQILRARTCRRARGLIFSPFYQNQNFMGVCRRNHQDPTNRCRVIC